MYCCIGIGRKSRAKQAFHVKKFMTSVPIRVLFSVLSPIFPFTTSMPDFGLTLPTFLLIVGRVTHYSLNFQIKYPLVKLFDQIFFGQSS